MGKGRMPQSLRKYIRFEKARIRREVLNFSEQEKQIEKLYQSNNEIPAKKVSLPKEQLVKENKTEIKKK